MIATINAPCKPSQGIQNIQAKPTPNSENIFLCVIGNLLCVSSPNGAKAITTGLIQLGGDVALSEDTDVSSETKQKDDTQDKTDSNLLTIPIQMMLTENPDAGLCDAKRTAVCESADANAKSAAVTMPETSLGKAVCLAQNGGIPAICEKMQDQLQDMGKTEQGAPKIPQNTDEALAKSEVSHDSIKTFSNYEALNHQGGQTISENAEPPLNKVLSKEQMASLKDKVSIGQKQTDAAKDADKLSQAGSFSMSSEKSQDIKHAGAGADGNNIMGQGKELYSKPDLSDKPSSKKSDSNNDALQDQTAAFALIKADITASKLQMPDQKEITLHESKAFLQICDKIQDNIKQNGSHSFNMKLYPEGLGEIQVTMTCKDDKVSLNILTDNSTTQKLLESQAGELKAALLTKNYEVSGLIVNAKSESSGISNNSFSFFDRNAQGGQNGQNERHPVYNFSSEVLNGDENPIYTNHQYTYAGRLEFWA